jgi:phosphoglycolate phosphatase
VTQFPISPSSFDAAIIDLDGTMVDTIGDFHAALNLMLTDLALPAVDKEPIGLMVGKGSEHLIRSVLAHVGADVTRYDAAWDRYQHHYLAINGRHSDVYAGVAQGLAALRPQACAWPA